VIFVFVITSIASTYLIGRSHSLYEWISPFLSRIRVRDLDVASEEDVEETGDHSIVLLGFFHEASSLLWQLGLMESEEESFPLLDKVLVIDFNPEVIAELKHRNIACLYGDVSHLETLKHAEIQHADLVVSTIPDAILRGTDNLKLLKAARRLCPDARVIVTADRISQALSLYSAGADLVFLPRIHSAEWLASMVGHGLRLGFESVRGEEVAHLRERREVLA
jgi:hypothetical protein